MVKPASLWSLFKTCSDPTWLGQVCRALGGQDVSLDFGQQQMYAQIRQDSEWMDERIADQQARWRDRQRAKRQRDKNGVTVTTRDKRDNGDVTIHPSVPPSVPLMTSNDVTRDDARRLPDPDEQLMYARQLSVPDGFIQVFNERIREIGYQYINRSGSTVTINRTNWKTCLRKFYEQELRKEQQKKQPGPQALAQPGYKAEMEMA